MHTVQVNAKAPTTYPRYSYSAAFPTDTIIFENKPSNILEESFNLRVVWLVLSLTESQVEARDSHAGARA